MILQTIKQILCLLCLCCFLQQSAFSQDDKNKPAYTLFDNTGKQISYGELIKRLSGYDVIFLGELHNCPINPLAGIRNNPVPSITFIKIN